jgi:hypothetical protein
VGRRPLTKHRSYDEVMIRRACSLIAVFAAVLMISGCGDDSITSQAPAAENTAPTATTVAPNDTAAAPTSTSTPLAVSPLTVVAVTEETTVAPSASIDPALQPLVDQAVADLATRLKIDASKIDTISAQSMSWPDGSLGCPQPGMAYTQVMVDGSLIQLSANGTSYSYHSGGSRAPFLCQKT